MSDEKNTSTYAVKLDIEVKEELQELLEGYKQETGTNAGDFIKTMLEIYKTNKIVSKVSSTDADIKELNILTNRIYSIYSNLIERNKSNNDNLQLEFTEQLSQKDNSIIDLKAKIQELKSENDELKNAFNNVCEEKKELDNINIQLQKLNDSLELNNSKLIEDTKDLHNFKEVNNKLLNEIEELKSLLASQQSDNIKLNDSIKDKDVTIKELNKAIDDNKNECISVIDRLKQDHMQEVQTMTDKLNIEKDKAILELKQDHQKVIEELNNKYNNKVNEYQTKYEKLFEEFKKLEKVKSIPKSKKSNVDAKNNK